MKEKQVLLKDGCIITGFENDYIMNIINTTHDFYEKKALERFSKYLDQKGVIYDIGANIGNHTVYFSKYLCPKKIYAFEPVHECFDLLSKNIKQNNIPNVEIHNVAVGNMNSTTSMEIDTTNIGSSKISIKNLEDNIQVITLDSLNINPPDFIKIDVEGYEQFVLSGAKKILTEHSPIIWVEIFRNNFLNVDNLLTEFGYCCLEKYEHNYIYKKPNNENEKDLFIQNLKKYTFEYYDTILEEARAKYKYISQNEKMLKKTIDNANLKYREMTQSANIIKERLKNTTENLEEKKKEIKEIKNLISFKENEIAEIKKELDRTREKNSKRENEIAEIKKELDNTREKNSKKENEIAETKKELNEARGKYRIVTANERKIKQDLYNNKIKSEEMINKLNEYMLVIEDYYNKFNELNDKRKYLLERTDILNKRNNMINDRYKALRNSKLGKITLKYWALRKKIGI